LYCVPQLRHKAGESFLRSALLASEERDRPLVSTTEPCGRDTSFDGFKLPFVLIFERDASRFLERVKLAVTPGLLVQMAQVKSVQRPFGERWEPVDIR
jgi:hypothetical protein